MCTVINDNVRGVTKQIRHTYKVSTVNMFMLQ